MYFQKNHVCLVTLHRDHEHMNLCNPNHMIMINQIIITSRMSQLHLLFLNIDHCITNVLVENFNCQTKTWSFDSLEL